MKHKATAAIVTELLQRERLNPNSLAKRLGCSASTVLRWKKGDTQPDRPLANVLYKQYPDFKLRIMAALDDGPTKAMSHADVRNMVASDRRRERRSFVLTRQQFERLKVHVADTVAEEVRRILKVQHNELTGIRKQKA